MKVATFFLAPILAIRLGTLDDLQRDFEIRFGWTKMIGWTQMMKSLCNRKVVITHTGYDGHNKLAKWGSGQLDVGTHSSYELYDDQIWTLECDPHNEPYLYIVNAKYYPARLTKLPTATGTYRGNRYTDQLWKISCTDYDCYDDNYNYNYDDNFNFICDYSCNYFSICNYEYPDRCLAARGERGGHGAVGSYKNAADTWRITPLFSNALLKWNRIKEFDNTRGQIPIVLTVTYQVGVSTSTTDSKFVEVGTELSLAVEQLGGMSSSFKSAIESSTTNGRTEIQTEETEFTIDAGEHWWLCQGTATLDSWRGRKDVQIISSQFAISTDAC